MLLSARRTSADKKGFTIAELLIVIAIIGILTAILVLALVGKVEQIRRTVDLENARSIRSQVTYALINGTMQLHEDDAGIVTLVSKKNIDIKGCVGKDKPKIMQLGRRITLPSGQKSLKAVVTSLIDGNYRCRQRKNDWYAVVVYGDGSSYYWEGKGTLVLTKGTRYSWDEVMGSGDG